MSAGRGEPGRGQIDAPTRERITAWVRRELEEQGFGSIREMARRMGVSPAYLSRVLARTQTPGLELLLRFTRTFGLPATRVLEEDPPRRFFVAAEPVAGARRAARPEARKVDVERWLARSRDAVREVKKVTADEIQRWKQEGRRR
jgi:transcriptional regulator with XRE-family HTH domain